MKLTENKTLRIIISGIILILCYKLIDNYRDIINIFKNIISVSGPFIAGIIIAFFLFRPIKKVEELIRKSKLKFVKEKSLGIATALVYVITFLIIGFIIMFITPRIYKNAQELVINFPKYYNTVTGYINDNEQLAEVLSKFFTENELEKKFFEMINMNNVNKWFGIVSGIASSFVSAFMAVVISIYLVIEKKQIFDFLRQTKNKIIKTDKINIAIMYGRKVIDMFYSYLSGMLIDAVIMGCISVIVLSLFKVPYAALLGLFVGIGNMIPFFGGIITTVIVTVISAVTTGIFNALWILVISLVLGQVDGNLIQPRILSSSTGISPLLVLLSVLIFGNLFGVPGMIIGVPVCAVLKMVVMDYLDNGRLDGSNSNTGECEK